jgi:hypothetical protein
MIVVAANPKGRTYAPTRVQGINTEGGCCTGPAMCTRYTDGQLPKGSRLKVIPKRSRWKFGFSKLNDSAAGLPFLQI